MISTFRLVVAAAALVGVQSRASAQPAFSQHPVGFGITLALPASWVAESEADLARRRGRSLAAMRESSLTALRQLAADNQNTLLFAARDSRNVRNSANLNVTVSPELHDSSFAKASEPELAELVQGICQSFGAQAADAGGVASCDRHEVVWLANRAAVVIHQTAVVPSATLDNKRTVVLFPAGGLLFTLSLSLHSLNYDSALVKVVLASVRFPGDP